jgi:hypothetical protein
LLLFSGFARNTDKCGRSEKAVKGGGGSHRSISFFSCDGAYYYNLFSTARYAVESHFTSCAADEMSVACIVLRTATCALGFEKLRKKVQQHLLVALGADLASDSNRFAVAHVVSLTE